MARLSPFLVRHVLGVFAVVALASAPVMTNAAQAATLVVRVVDAQSLAVPGASCSLTAAGGAAPIAQTTSDSGGHAVFDAVPAGHYTLRVELDGFEPFVRTGVMLDASSLPDLDAVLAPAGVAQAVSVAAPPSSDTTSRAGSSPPAGDLARHMLQRLPLAVASFRDALPLVPGVLRSTTGELAFNGGPEAQSGLRVNGMNAVDPATGAFRLSVPVDAVEGVQVFLHPYTAEYGQFTGGITRVDTRPGSDRWRFELNDFFPDFRFVDGRVRGIAEDAPHMNLSGPLFGKRLLLSQSAAYTIANRPVRGLDFPVNETRTQSQNYFTQLDFTVRPGHSQMVTLGYAPERRDFIGLDVFRPQPTTPSARQRDLVLTARDNSVVGSGLLTSSASVSRFDTNVLGRGTEELTLAPTGESGNYFATQARRSMRTELLEVYTLPTQHWLGSHDVRLGVDVNDVSSRLNYRARPVNIVRGDGTLAERVEFDPAATIRARNREYIGFAQDRWTLGDRVALDAGIRYEDQRIADATLIAPRAGFAWAPAADGRTVIRGGVGVFFDKVPLNIRSFAQYPSRTVTRFASDGFTILDRRRYTNLLVDAVGPTVSASELATDQTEFVPGNVTWNLQVDHIVRPGLAFRANLVNSHTDDLYIVEPRSGAPGTGTIALSSVGRSSYRAEELAVRFGRADRLLNVSYTHSRARGDLNGFSDAFGDFATPIVRSNEYSQLPTDAPHRLLAWGSVALPRRFSLAPIFEVRTGFPYQVRDAAQDFVGLRNSDATRFPRFVALDLEGAKELQVTKKYAVRLSLRAFNLTNHFNPRDVHANTGDPLFGRFVASYRRYFTGGFDILF